MRAMVESRRRDRAATPLTAKTEPGRHRCRVWLSSVAQDGSHHLATRHLTTSRPLDEGEADAVTFSAQDAARPVLTEDESVQKLLRTGTASPLFELEASAIATDRVRAALLERLPAGQSFINAVATQLMLSPRTLQRQLRAEGISYRIVLSDTRENSLLALWNRGSVQGCVRSRKLRAALVPLPFGQVRLLSRSAP
ncbi:hypothetical protein ACWGJV_31980 [Streptomyces tendae]